MPHEPRAARRAHTAHRSHVQPRRPVTWWIVAAVVAALAAGGIVWWTTSARTQVPPGATLGERVRDEGFDHVAVGTQIQYQARPPASGPHYPAPAPAGVYPEGLLPGFWIHSLEHGYIVLLYKPPVSDARNLEFREMVRDFPKSKYRNVKLVVAPYEEMSHPFAVLAWDWRLFMDTFDRAKVLEFYKGHVDQGREDLP